MSRLLAAAAAAAVLALPAPAADAPAGRWKLRFAEGDQTLTFLVNLAQADGKWVGDFLGSTARLRTEPEFGPVEVAGDAVKFSLKFGGREFISFDGVVSKDGKKMTGSLSQFGGPLRLTELYPSQLKKLDDPADLARENAGQFDAGPELFDAGFTALAAAAEKKVPADEARGLADKLAKASAGYGGRWERTVALRLATTLAEQKDYADVALVQARRAERMLTDDTPAAAQMEVLGAVARVLTAAGKADEAKKYAGMVQKLEVKDYADYAKATLGFVTEPFAGRKGKSDRTVLVEVFTGSECPPCAAVDLGADGLVKAFKPTEVLVVQYHLHVPAPDPLTGPDNLDRAEFYRVEGSPTVLIDGKTWPGDGGPAAAAKAKYASLREAIEPRLETPAGAKLAVTVAAGEKGFAAKATVSDLAAPGEKMRLRFLLVENRVRYPGGNGVRYHHNVVREIPGGPKGFALTEKTHEQAVAFDVPALRDRLGKYLAEAEKAEGPFSQPDRPLALADLKLIAFVQNDETKEVLQAVQVDVK